ncbi:MAG: UDP-N-acetylmuramate--L-alanine ligase [Rikenellaceae bacterium]
MNNIYFLGIGGIGMSALARYFLHNGNRVGGYDRVRTPLTQELEAAGATIHYDDSVSLIEQEFLSKESTVVVYTPAVPASHSEMRYFVDNGYNVIKRSRMLGYLSEGKYVMAVAGTHGKSSTTTLLSWLNHAVCGEGSAFLGAISRNFGSNMVLGSGARLAVEADEFDRSFLQLHPNVAIITSTDADHLDIYGTHESLLEAFAQFASQIKSGGALILKNSLSLDIPNEALTIYRYSYDEECDFYAKRLSLGNDGLYSFDIVTPSGVVEGCHLGVAGRVNIENCVAAVAALWVAQRADGKEFDFSLLRSAISEYKGVKRRFELYVNREDRVYIDDYAHHPAELLATITSIRDLFPSRHLTAIFQPHLYTRTRDNYLGFAQVLSKADRVILLPIYPAREEPIEGIESEMIEALINDVPCQITPLSEVVEQVAKMDSDIVVTFGAGDIDTLTGEIASILDK